LVFGLVSGHALNGTQTLRHCCPIVSICCSGFSLSQDIPELIDGSPTIPVERPLKATNFVLSVVDQQRCRQSNEGEGELNSLRLRPEERQMPNADFVVEFASTGDPAFVDVQRQNHETIAAQGFFQLVKRWHLLAARRVLGRSDVEKYDPPDEVVQFARGSRLVEDRRREKWLRVLS
jgi:hypothetical protein